VKPIKTLIVDDSALIRSLLTDILSKDSRIEVVGAAADPFEAREMIKKLNPDVLTLDIEMPKMDGVTFLKNLMRLRPMPVIMISTLTEKGAPITFECLEIGAVDYVPKPKMDAGAGLKDYSQRIVSKVRAAATANVRTTEVRKAQTSETPGSFPLMRKNKLRNNYICAIGASTGGTEAIKEVLRVLPKESPPIVITQHIPASFSLSFAKRLDANSAITVYEAKHGQPIEPGCAYLAPGDEHLKILRTPRGYVCQLDAGPPVNRHRPAVDVLFDSVTEQTAGNCGGIILTGMGADGAEGMLRMRQKGCQTAAQDEKTSVVWGMPGAAVKLNAAMEVLPLNKVADFLIRDAYAAR